MKIILDTNFLIYCAKKKLDYAEEIEDLLNENYELIVPLQVIEEVKKIIEKKKEKYFKKGPRYKKTTGRDKEAANLALQLLEANKVKKINCKGKTVDEVILKLAKENKKNIVCTLDRELRKKLRRVILINKEGRLVLTR